MVAPVVTTLLFLAIFLAGAGRAARHVDGVPYREFLAPGLVMMAMAQNAFANTSSSLMIAKVQGNIVDVLMPPLSPGELTWGFALGGVTRGLVVGSRWRRRWRRSCRCTFSIGASCSSTRWRRRCCCRCWA